MRVTVFQVHEDYTGNKERYFDEELLSYIKKRRNTDAQYFLLLHENSLDVKDNTEATLLHYAARFGNEVMIEYILSFNNKILDSQDNRGRTPLMLAVIGKNELAIQVLLKANANIFISDTYGKNVIDMVFDSTPISLSMVKMFFHAGPVNKITEIFTREALARKLIDAGCSLHHVVFIKSSELVRLLLDNGYSVNAIESKLGKTALHVAVQLQDVEMVKLLLSYGAKLNIMDSLKRLPLSYTNYTTQFNSNAQIEIFKIIFEKIATPTRYGAVDRQFFSILERSGENALELILQSDIDVKATSPDGCGILHYLVRNEHFGHQEFKNPNFDVHWRNNHGATALHFAVKGHVNAVQFLLDHKADVNVKDFVTNETPLFAAFRYWKESDDVKCMLLLLQSGADVQVVARSLDNNDGIDNTIFDEALVYSTSIWLLVLEPMIVHLAINKQVQGTQITGLIQETIDSRPELKACFDACESSLLEMMVNRIGNSSVTLYEFLIENNERTSKYVRNEELVADLTKIIREWIFDPVYLSDLLKSGLDKAIQRREIREKAAHCLCLITGLCYNVIEPILDYLTFEDFKKIKKAFADVA